MSNFFCYLPFYCYTSLYLLSQGFGHHFTLCALVFHDLVMEFLQVIPVLGHSVIE
jgi:hypothetical protein